MKNTFIIPLMMLLMIASCKSSPTRTREAVSPAITSGIINEGDKKPFAGKEDDSGKGSGISGEELAAIREMFLEGIDFGAGGNDPAWSLSIDFDKVMRFKSDDGLMLNTPAVMGQRAMDANVTFYHAVTEAGELRITISGEKCTDAVTKNESDYLVRIEARYSSESGYRTYSGCGRYIFDYRLHDIWVLKELNGIALDTARLPKGLPVFEFDPGNEKLTGHTGCNNFNARIEVKGDKISFGKLITTRMACPDMSVEQSLFSAADNKTFSYTVNEGTLTLEDGEGKVMVFRKGD